MCCLAVVVVAAAVGTCAEHGGRTCRRPDDQYTGKRQPTDYTAPKMQKVRLVLGHPNECARTKTPHSAAASALRLHASC